MGWIVREWFSVFALQHSANIAVPRTPVRPSKEGSKVSKKRLQQRVEDIWRGANPGDPVPTDAGLECGEAYISGGALANWVNALHSTFRGNSEDSDAYECLFKPHNLDEYTSIEDATALLWRNGVRP